MIKTARTIYRAANKGGGPGLHWLLSAAVHAGLLGGLALLPPGGAPDPGYPVRLVRLAPPEAPAPATEASPPRQVPEAPPEPQEGIAPPSPLPPKETAAPKPMAPGRTAQPAPPPAVRKKETASSRPATREVPAAARRAAKPAPSPQPEEERAAPPAEARPAPPAAAPAASPRISSLPAPPGEETLSPQILRERLAQIVARIEKAKRYPEGARLMGAEGTAVVAFRIRPDGRVEGLAIRETSGHSSLDEATLEAVRQAQPLPYVRHALVLPIRYALREAER